MKAQFIVFGVIFPSLVSIAIWEVFVRPWYMKLSAYGQKRHKAKTETQRQVQGANGKHAPVFDDTEKWDMDQVRTNPQEIKRKPVASSPNINQGCNLQRPYFEYDKWDILEPRSKPVKVQTISRPNGTMSHKKNIPVQMELPLLS